jgi:hypothetical protein
LSEPAERAEHSVVVFYRDGGYERIISFVGAREAVECAKSLTQSVAARLNMIARIIITDGGDFTNFVWTPEAGVAYPPRAESRAP